MYMQMLCLCISQAPTVKKSCFEEPCKSQGYEFILTAQAVTAGSALFAYPGSHHK